MGLPDLEAVFSSLDRTRKGYLNENEVQLFDESLNFTALGQRQVNASIEQICGRNSAGRVHKQYFAQLLSDLQRRRRLQESLRWDFIALDANGSNRIPTKDALTLFQIAHGDLFSTSTWNRFIASREEPSSDVCFDEIFLWLCELPEGQPATSGELIKEQQRLKTELEERLKREYEEHNAQQLQQGESARARERHDAEEKTKRLARRKFARWEHEGLKAMLFDDGLDDGQEVIIKMRSTIGVTELMDALQQKYDILRKKLFWQMLKFHSGDAMWTAMSEGEQLEMYQQLEFDEQRARKTGCLGNDSQLMPGSTLSHGASLQGLMGDLQNALAKMQWQLNEERMELRASGMAEFQVEVLLESRYQEKVLETTTSSQIIVSLEERFRNEKDSLLSLLHCDDADQRLKQLVILYSRVIRQQDLVNLEDTFFLAAIAAGLAERVQDHNTERFDPDRMRQETLAGGRLLARKNGMHKLPPSMDESGHRCQGMTELQMAIVHQTTWKHALERDVLMSLIQGREGSTSKVTVQRMTPSQRSSRLATLRNQRTSWRDSSASHMLSHRDVQRKILQEAVLLYHEDTRLALNNRKDDVTDEIVDAAIVADVQQYQDKEFESILLQISQKNEKQLTLMKKSLSDAVREEHFDNMASILLGTFECNSEERIFIIALEEKYEKLRDLLLLHALRMEHNIAWHRLSNEERAKLLSKKKSDELKLRQEGQLSEMDRLLLDMPPDIGTLRELIGPTRAEMARRFEELYEHQLQQAYMGQDYSKVYIVEAATGPTASENLLADLVQRLYSEQDALIAQLRRQPAASEQHRWLPLVLLRVECERIDMEEQFDVAALGVGLLERIVTERSDADRRRQLQLSAQRCESRTERTMMGRHYHKQVDDYAWPHKGDTAGWMVSYLREIEKKHADERELLLSMLQDPSLSDLCDVAMRLTEAERKTRLPELHSKWQQLDFEKPADQDNNMSILEEAAAIRSIFTKKMMASRYGEDGAEEVSPQEVTSEEVAVVLLAEVQDEQDRELAAVITNIVTLNEDDLKMGRECEIKARHSAMSTHLITVLTRYDGAVANEQLIEALELKYDAIRDKLLMESLIAQLGEYEWSQLSEEQRQRRLMMLRLEERRLRQEGKFEELHKLLDASALDGERLRLMLAENKEEHQRRLQQRMALRQKRLEQGMNEEECDKLEAEEDNEERKRRNILLDLHQCFNQEKEALMRSLNEQSNRIDAERRRQMALVKLRQEQRQSLNENKFAAAALLISGANDYDNLVDAERRRQLDLARERLAARKIVGQTLTASQVLALPAGELEHQENREGVVGKQDGVMRELEERHSHERQLLLAVFDDPALAVYRKRSADLDRHLKVEALSRLHSAQQQWKQAVKVSQKDKLNLFLEAAALRLDIMSEDLKREGQSCSDDDVQVALLAELQDYQCREAAAIVESLLDMDAEALKCVKEEQMTLRQQQRYDGLSAVLLVTEKQQLLSCSEQQLVDALEQKYNALRDKLLIEALMKEMGETEWARLSEKQRQARLMELKREEKRLRMAGRYDDAAALLGEYVIQDKALAEMLGESAAEQMRRQKARMERRRQLVAERREAGLSVDDAILDAIQNEEEEVINKEKRRNILELLEHHFDDEKEALLAAMRARDGKLSTERRRQLEMAKMKQAKRQMEKEDKFGGAALLISAAREDGQLWDEKLLIERERLRALAKERVAARKARHRDAESEQQQIERLKSEDQQQNDRNITVEESLMKTVERKQEEERNTLMILLATAKERPSLDEDTTEDLQVRLSQIERELDEQQTAATLKVRSLFHAESAVQKDEYYTEVVKQRTRRFELLTKATALRLKSEMVKQTDQQEDDVSEEVNISLLTQLQQRQASENRILNVLMEQQNESVLAKLRDAQVVQAREGQMENVQKTIFALSNVEMSEDGEHVEKLKADMEREFEMETRSLQEKWNAGGPDEKVAIENEMKKLETEHEAKRQALAASLKHQLMKRQEIELAQKEGRDPSEASQQNAVSHMLNAAEIDASQLENGDGDKRNYKMEMQEKLAERRKARRNVEQVRSAARRTTPEDGAARADSISHGSLKREKTIVDIDLSESEKEALYQQLIDQQAALNKKLTADHKKHEAQVQERLDRMRKRRCSEAADLMKLAERQRSHLEKAVKEERDRHTMMTKERVARMRYEKTLTMKSGGGGAGGSAHSQRFDSMLSDDTSQMSEDDKMELAAKRMQQRFEEQEKEMAPTRINSAPLDVINESESDDENLSDAACNKPKDAMQIMKERRAKKKQQKENQP